METQTELGRSAAKAAEAHASNVHLNRDYNRYELAYYGFAKGADWLYHYHQGRHFDGTEKSPEPLQAAAQEEKEPLKTKPVVVERYADNGEHSHWALIDADTGIELWTE